MAHEGHDPPTAAIPGPDRAEPAVAPEPAPLPKAPSRRRATLWSLFFSYGSMVLVLIRNLALVPLYLHYIGLEEYGAWLATGGVLSYLTVVDFGLMGLFTQQAAVAYGAGDADRLGKTIGIGLRISLALAVLVGAVAAVLAPFVPTFLGLTSESAQRLGICFLIVALSNSLNLVSFATGGVLKAFQRTFVPGMLNVVSDAASIGITILLVVGGWGLYGIAFGLVVRSLVAVGGNTAACLWVCYRDLRLRLSCRWKDSLPFWKLSTYQLAMRIGAAAGTQEDAFIVGVILGPKLAGAYVLTIRAHDMVRTLAARFADAIMPALAHLHGEGQPSRFRSVTLMAVRFQAVLALVGMAGVYAFNESFMRLWVGPDLYVGDTTNLLMALWGVSYVALGALWQALYAMGLVSPLAKITWLEVGLKLPLLIGLLYASGVIGAPIATVVAHLMAVIVLVVLGIRQMQLSRDEVIGLATDLLRIGVACALAAFFVVNTVPPPGIWLHFALQAGCYAVLGVLLTICFNPRLAAVLFRAGWGRSSHDVAQALP